jgi:hypothetical protein
LPSKRFPAAGVIQGRDRSLAAEADLHTVSVSRIDSGKQNPTWIALSSLADVLEVELVDLVRLADERSA